MKKNDLYKLTHQKSFLGKSSAILALFFLIIGTGISFLNTQRVDLFEQMMAMPEYVEEYEGELDHFSNGFEGIDVSSALIAELQSDRPFIDKLGDIQSLFRFTPEAVVLSGLPVPSEFAALSSNEYAIASAFIPACAAKGKAGWKVLAELAGADEAPAGANYALALVYELHRESGVDAALLREIHLHNSDPARKMYVHSLLRQKNFDELETLQDLPEYDSFINDYIQREIAIEKMDWPTLIKIQLAASYEHVNTGMVILALISGIVWLSVLLRFNGHLSWKSTCIRLAIPALILGALSAHATILVIFAQEHYLGYTEGTTDLQQFIYCILGIGLREEALKLLFFVPLIPFVRKLDDLELLTIAGIVGLGFAIEENINYFEGSAGLSALGRFATANFLHIALTALCGLTLARAFIHRGSEIGQAGITFVLAVVAHGLYDAFIMVPMLEDYSIFTSTIFILIGYQYFSWLRHLRDRWDDPVSVTSIFTWGAVVVTGLSFCLFAWQVGATLAFQAIGYEILGVGIILFMFFREIPETLR